MTQANAADRKDVRRAEKAAKIADRARLEIITQVMSASPGRQYMLERLESAHVFQTSFTPDPLQMAFNEGERNQGLQLLNDIMRSCPDQYIQMMRERNERDAASERARSQDTDRGDSESGDAAGDTEGSGSEDAGRTAH